jgi:hypothetical protein
MERAGLIILGGYVIVRCVDVLCAAQSRHSQSGRIFAYGAATTAVIITCWELAAALSASAYDPAPLGLR